MSFLDDSPELAADLRDVFNILYPPSPTNTQDDWEDAEANSSTLAVSNEGAGEIVDLDGPVDDLAPLDVHERSAGDVAHEPTSESKFPGYVESLLGKLSRVSRRLDMHEYRTLMLASEHRNEFERFWTLPSH